MVTTNDAREVIKAAVKQAQARALPWQFWLRAALALLLKILPDILPLVLADAEDAGVNLATDAAALARSVRP